jgi:hypothetical protein
VSAAYLPESMPLNLLSVFYRIPDRWQLDPSGYVNISWKCDPVAVLAIGEAGSFDFVDVSLTNMQQVNDCFDRLLIADRTLETVVIDRLYRIALKQPQPSRNNCWFNFIAAMTIKVARHTWQKIPKPQQSEELLERLLTPTLRIQQLLTGFDPEYHHELLIGLQAWTYQVVKYNSFADLRANGNPYFGLSNFGVVARSGLTKTRMALLGNLPTDQLDTYISICKVFKNYLSSSKIPVNQLELTNWQDILTEVRSLKIEVTIEELRDRLDRVGSFIRAHSSPIIEKYDDPSLFMTLDNHFTPESDIEALDEIFVRIFAIIDRFIDSLSTEARKIITLRHQKKLKQNSIAEAIAKDRSLVDWHDLSQADIKKLIKQYQPYISRQLGKIYLSLLDCLHSQVPHPNDGKIQKNSEAIAAIEQLLDKYFHQNHFRDLT